LLLINSAVLHLEELSNSPIDLNDFITVLRKYVSDPEWQDVWIESFKTHNRHWKATEGLVGSVSKIV
jgi:hypothetical protein